MSNSLTSFDVIPAGTPAGDVAVRDRKPRAARRAGGMAARYDAADTHDENRNHWAKADLLSASSTNSVAVRATLRTRSRYERANNGYASGIIRARTNDTIGTGPRLQLDFPAVDPDFQQPIDPERAASLARQVERLWCGWCAAVGYADKLRVMADAEDTDGEAFALFTAGGPGPVTLDLRVIECDRVTTPSPEPLAKVDGLVLDDAGKVIAYQVLRQHPGDLWGFGNPLAFDTVAAHLVVHLFAPDRPEQYRGVPLLTPALPLYAILRRYTLASLGSAELGAMIAGVIEQPNAPPDASGDEAPEFEAMDQIPFARNALLTLAGGQTAKAFESKNPGVGYAEFKAEVLTEAGRAAGENRNTATGSSAEYNYSSGRLDHLPRQRGIRIRRSRYDRAVNDRTFELWAAEAAQIPGYLPAGLPPVETWDWRWQWDGFESIDPVKDAVAVQTLKAVGLTTDADELAKQGKDWREHYNQLAREKAMRDRLGIEPAPAPPPAAPPPAAAPAYDPTADPAEDPADA